MRDEEQIISNIKLISLLIVISCIGIIICLGIDKFFSKSQDKEIQESSEDIYYGDIIEEENPASNKYPKEINSEISNMVGTTYLNLMQSGKIVSNDNIIIYPIYNNKINNYDIYLFDKKTKNEKIILENMDCYFLHLYDNYLFGVYNKTYDELLKKDCIFIYNLKKDILTTYDKNLGDISNRFLTSFSIDGKQMYFTEYYTNSLFSLSFDGKKIKKLVDMKKTSFTGYSRILNIENNIISFINDNNIGYFDLDTNNVNYENKFNLKYDNYKINFIQNTDNIEFYLEDKLIYTGNINTLNYNESIYFSDNNKLYKYTKELGVEELLNTSFIINQIYLDKDFIILFDDENNIIFLKGDTYEIYSEFIN